MHTDLLAFTTQNFISEIRSCSGKDAEKNRVDKELGKIRQKFSSTKNISGGAFEHVGYLWHGSNSERGAGVLTDCSAAQSPKTELAVNGSWL